MPRTPKRAEIIELLLAITAIGAAAAPLNPAYTHDEFAFCLEDLSPRLLLLPQATARQLGKRQQCVSV